MSKNITEMSFDELFPDDLHNSSFGSGKSYSDRDSSRSDYSEPEEDSDPMWSSYDEDAYDYSSEDYGSDISSLAAMADNNRQNNDLFSQPPGAVPESRYSPAQTFQSQPPQDFMFTDNMPPQSDNTFYGQPSQPLQPPQPPMASQFQNQPQYPVNTSYPGSQQRPGQGYGGNYPFTGFDGMNGSRYNGKTQPRLPLSIVMGLLSLFTSMLFPVGLVIAVIGLIMGGIEISKAKKEGTPQPPSSKAGMILCVFGIIFSIFSSGSSIIMYLIGLSFT